MMKIMIHIKRKLLFTAIACIMLAAGVIAQTGIRNRGARIIITEGAILYISGDSLADYTNTSYNSSLHGRVDLDGMIIIEGDWINSALAGGVFQNIDSMGEVWMTGVYAQTIGGTRATDFEDLVIDKSDMVLLEVSANVFDSLVLNNGLIKLGAYHLILGASAKLDGSPSASSMVIATSTGQLRKWFSAPGSFTYPVGDDDGTIEYSPVTVDMNSGTFGSSAYVGVRLTDDKHSQNTSTTNYLTRYWTLASYNISGYSADISLNYTDADISGTEATIYGGRYSSTNWFLLNPVNTASNEISAIVNSLGQFTGGEQAIFSVSISLSDNGITEGNEDAGEIYVTLTNDNFVTTFTQSAWTVTNLPQGVTKGTVMRTGTKTATIALTGNRTNDYDTDITNVTVQIAGSQMVYSTSSVSASAGVILDANDDPESITLSDNGINEGTEDNRIIGVKLIGGTFAASLNTGSWVVGNLPQGVSAGLIQRISYDSVTIRLSGNRTVDYDTDITDVSVTIPGVDVDDYSDPTISANTGILFDAYNDPEAISMSNREIILEASEDGKLIDVTLSGGTFVDPIDSAYWTLINLPVGVKKGEIIRIGATTATIQLSGNRTVNYDEDITNTTLTINANQADDHTGSALSVNTGVIFTAVDESLLVTLYDDGNIQEGAEDGELISVVLGFPKVFISTLDPDSFILSNLPVGVTKGTIIRVSDDSVTIELSGNRIKDYDANITNLTVRIDSSQIVNSSSDGIASSGVTFTALVDEPETISISTTGITEGSEDGAQITATVTNGTFAIEIHEDNWSLSNLPSGVEIGSVVKNSPISATITLAGDREVDFDSHITTVALTVTASEVDDHPSGNITSTNTITIQSIMDNESISISDNGIYEGAEEDGIITVTLIGGTYVSSVNPDHWNVNNLPEGVNKGNVTRIDNGHVEIELNGNRQIDYDNTVTNVRITVTDDEVDEYSGVDLIDSTGITLIANPDPEILTLSDDGNISEASENGEEIFVEVTGGTITSSLNPSNWVIHNLPDGVSIGNVLRNTDTTVTIALVGNRETDYDQTYSAILSVNPEEIEATDDTLWAYSGADFIANNDVESILMYDDGDIIEGAEDGEEIQVILIGGTFIPYINQAAWNMINLPTGVNVDTIILSDRTHATIMLQGNRTQDYDEAITNVSLTIQDSEIDDLSGYNLFTNTGVEFDAILETAEIEPFNVDTLKENNLDTALILITLFNDEFFDGNLNTLFFSLNNTPSGVSIDSVSYLNQVNALISLAYDGTDFDYNVYDFSITIQGEELLSRGDITTNDTLILATLEDQGAVISHSGLSEDNLDGAQINLTLLNETFVDNVIADTNMVLQNAPQGVSVANVQYDDSVHATIVLAFNATDFDDTIPDFALLIESAELSRGEDILTNSLVIVPVIEEESLLISHEGLHEDNLEGALIDLSLVEEIFADASIDIGNITLNNSPAGVTINSVIYADSAHAGLYLAYDGTDFDSDASFSITIAAAELSKGGSLISNALMISALDDIESINMEDDGEIRESLENGEIISVILTGGTFVGILDSANWTLTNIPSGVRKGAITRLDATHATITLSGNRTEDYNQNITNLTLTVDEAEVDDHIGDPLVTNTGVTFIAEVVGMNNSQELKVFVYSYLNNIYIQNNMPANFEGRAVVYNLLGQAIIDKKLEPATITRINVPWLTNEYIVKIYIGEKIYSQKVFIYVK